MKTKNILVLTYWSYRDALIQAYTLPYIHIILEQLPPGSRVFLVTFEQPNLAMTINQRSQVRARLRLQGIELVDLNYSSLYFLNFFNLGAKGLRLLMLVFLKRIRFIHALCTPAGSLGYVLSKITGRKLIIDSYEPHAEAMVENNTWKKNNIRFKVLFYFERKLTEHASIIISATAAMKKYASEKYNFVIKKIFVKPACVDTSVFNLSRKKDPELLQQLKLTDKIVCVYAGKFGGIYLTHEVFDFFRVAEARWGERFRALILTNHDQNELLEWAKTSGFDPKKMLVRFIPHNEIPDYIGLGDFAITPVKPVPTKRYCTPIKDGEYWALGLPVVIPANISDDSEIIEQNHIGSILRGFNIEEYRRVVDEIDTILHRVPKAETEKAIASIAQQYRNFDIARSIYHSIYGVS